jgi:predicted MFS family arabinose efflux permease
MTSYFIAFIKNYFSNYSGLSKPCWQGIALNFIEALCSGVFFFLSIYLVDILHISILTATTIIACYGIGAIFGGFFGGKLSDKWTPSRVSSGSLLILAVAYLSLIQFKTVYLLMVVIFIIGIATYSFLTSNHVGILNQCSNSTERLKALSIITTVSNLGISLAAVMVGVFSHYGFQYIFFISSVFFFLSSSYLLLQQRKNKISTATLQGNNPDSLRKSNTINSTKITWLVLTCVLLAGIVIAQTSSTYSIFIRQTFPHLGIKAVSILFILNSLLIVFCQTPLVNLFSKYNKVLAVGIGAFLIGIGMSILGFASTFSLAILSCIIYTLGEMVFFSMAQLVCYQSSDEKKKGLSLGLFRTFYATSRVIGPAIGGEIYYHFGGNMVWYFSGLLGVVCLGGCIYYYKEAS